VTYSEEVSMDLEKMVSMCPYLTGSHDGVMCSSIQDLIRNIDGIDLNICASRRFEQCHIYISKLQDVQDAKDEVLCPE
jgi:hypothetical protein